MLTGTSVIFSHVDLVAPRDLCDTRFPDASPEQSRAFNSSICKEDLNLSDAFRVSTSVVPVQPASVAMTLDYS